MKYTTFLLLFFSLSLFAKPTTKEEKKNSSTQPSIEVLNEQLIRRQVESIRRRSELQSYKRKEKITRLSQQEQGFLSNDNI